MTLQELGHHIGCDLANDTDIIKMLQCNTRIRFEGPDRVSFLPYMGVRNGEDLVRALRRLDQENGNQGGISTRDLSYDLTGDIQTLESRNLVMSVALPNNQKVVFLNRLPEVKKLDDELVALWGKIDTPDEADLEKEFQKSGLKAMDMTQRPKQPSAKADRKRPGRARRGKISNTHLVGQFDFS